MRTFRVRIKVEIKVRIKNYPICTHTVNLFHYIPDLLDVPQELMSDFDAWAQDVLSYQF